jgi:hypothetical protein
MEIVITIVGKLRIFQIVNIVNIIMCNSYYTLPICAWISCRAVTPVTHTWQPCTGTAILTSRGITWVHHFYDLKYTCQGLYQITSYTCIILWSFCFLWLWFWLWIISVNSKYQACSSLIFLIRDRTQVPQHSCGTRLSLHCTFFH